MCPVSDISGDVFQAVELSIKIFNVRKAGIVSGNRAAVVADA